MKKVSLFFVLILLSLQVFSLTLDIDKSVYEKGETITINGSSANPVTIQILNGNIDLIEEVIVPQNGSFSFSFETNLLHPSGEWLIRTTDPQESLDKTIQVNTPPKGAYYVITFFSPSVGEIQRAREVEVSVEVTDDGKRKANIEVLMFGALGEQIELSQKEDGVYSTNYSIPFNAPLTEWDLIVTAKQFVGTEERGGERIITLTPVESPIIIEVIRPSGQLINLGEPVSIIVKPTYSSGTLIDESASVIGKIDNESINFERDVQGNYVANYTPTNIGELRIELTAIDSAQNNGSKVLTVIVGGFFESILRQYWLPIAIIIIVLAFGIYKTQSKLFYDYKLKYLNNQKNDASLRLKRIQEDYYKKRTIDRPNYESASADLNRKLTHLNAEIKDLTSKNKLNNEKTNKLAK